MNIRDNPHTVYHLWGAVSYWQGNAACGCEDEWTYATLKTTPSYGVGTNFTDAAELRDFCHHLDKAFDAGKRARSAEFRKLLEDGK